MTRHIGFAKAAVSPCFGAVPPGSPSVTERGDHFESSICRSPTTHRMQVSSDTPWTTWKSR